MTEALRRTARTFCQALLGSLLTSGVLSTVSERGIVDWSAAKKAGLAALAAAVIAAVTLVHNLLEEHTPLPAVLKDESGQTWVWMLVGALAAIVLLALFGRLDL